MIESWKILPRSNIPQFSYSEQDDPASPGEKVFHLNISDSGFMVPPAQPGSNGLKFLKSPDYFWSVMAQVESLFTSQRSLGALGTN